MPRKEENKLLFFLNNAKTPEQIVNKFCKEKKKLITKKQAKAILKCRNNLPQQVFTSFRHFKMLLSENVGIKEEVVDNFVSEPEDRLIKNCPVLLLPVRLETRFVDNDLLIRIYPDKIF